MNTKWNLTNPTVKGHRNKWKITANVLHYSVLICLKSTLAHKNNPPVRTYSSQLSLWTPPLQPRGGRATQDFVWLRWFTLVSPSGLLDTTGETISGYAVGFVWFTVWSGVDSLHVPPLYDRLCNGCRGLSSEVSDWTVTHTITSIWCRG
jgi:hypothetical protein